MPNNEKQICPICGKAYDELEALSRKDNKTMICSDCGTEEAMSELFNKDEEWNLRDVWNLRDGSFWNLRDGSF